MRQLTRWVLNLALFSAALAAVGGWLCEHRNERSSGHIDDKCRHVSVEDSPYDTLVFGSSRVQSGFVPAVFDRRMAEFGSPTRSFNLAAGGMFPHEVNVVLRRVLKNPPPGLRRIFVEVSRWTPEIREKNRFTQRVIAWHTTREILPVLRSSRRFAAAEETSSWWGIQEHLAHFVAHWTNLGEGPSIWAEAIEPAVSPEGAKSRSWASGGFVPMSVDIAPKAEQWRAAFLRAAGTRYLERIEKKNGSHYDETDGDLLNPEALLDQCHWIVDRGIDLIYFVPPTIEPIRIPGWLEGVNSSVELLRFDRPALYPVLYEPEQRFDFEHLTPGGAELWSIALAERYAETL